MLTMSPRVRRATFTAHVATSAGWVGAVLVFLALAVVGLTSRDERTVRGAYLVMAPAAWFVLVPLAHASLVSGIALSLGTAWGLFRHYWVVLKLLITVFSTAVLLMYMATFQQMAGVAADPIVDIETVRNASPLVHAILALVLLLAATVLGVYKPFGLTTLARRNELQSRDEAARLTRSEGALLRRVLRGMTARWACIAGISMIVLVLIVVVLHIAGIEFRAH